MFDYRTKMFLSETRSTTLHFLLWFLNAMAAVLLRIKSSMDVKNVSEMFLTYLDFPVPSRLLDKWTTV